MNPEQTKNSIIAFLRQAVGEKPAIIGLSGGLDSSVVAYLAVEALGKDKIHAFILPSSSNTENEINRAEQIAELLSIQYSVFSIDSVIKNFQKDTGLFATQKSLGNLKARVRMSILYGKANELNGMVLGTGNKTEIMTGYFTKYGDAGVDLLPIGDLYKTEVRALAKHLKIPPEIIDAPPTAGLWDGQTDEGEMGITYERLDQILKAIEAGEDLSAFDETDVRLVKDLIDKCKHKRKLPAVCKIQGVRHKA